MTSSRELINIANSFESQLPAHQEPAWKILMQNFHSGHLFNDAFVGGLLSDRLSWVFLAAYQSAVRACFDDLPVGWVSFAASEDKTGEYPGTSLNDDKLQGNKSWIAAAENVDYLLVTLGTGPAASCLLVNVNQPGVTISTRPDPAFLGDMSQGRAHFDSIPVKNSDRRATDKAQNFGIAEPFFVLTAGCGYLIREGKRLSQEQISIEASNIADDLSSMYQTGFDSDIRALLNIQESLSPIAKACSTFAQTLSDQASLDWSANGRLLGMYARGLRSRVL